MNGLTRLVFNNRFKLLVLNLCVVLFFLFAFSRRETLSEKKLMTIIEEVNNRVETYNKNNHYIINNLKESTKSDSQSYAKPINLDNSYNAKDPSNIINDSNKNKCNIFNENQYSVAINGILYPRYLLLSQNFTYNFDCINKSSENPKVILAWNTFYGEKGFGYGTGSVKPFKNHHCPVTNCELTVDKSRLNEADYAVVLATDRNEGIPHERNSKTRWIWMNIESPFYKPSYAKFNGMFNYTSDYLYESEFGGNYVSQMRFLWAKNTTFNENHNYHEGKSGFLAGLISNCGAANKRISYMNALKNHAEVTIYGRCGIPCPANTDCRQYIGDKYKFFFSFENSICRDYITEKFFLMLKYNVIPVVFGGGNYSRFVPKTGYIDALDYESPQHLADYLKYLDKNVTAFNEYFQWKKHVQFLDYIVDYGMICDMCIQLHLEDFYGIKQQVINDFDKYWSRSKDCKRNEDIPQLKSL